MDRAKFQVTAPDASGGAITPKNPSRHFKKKSARAPGRSGKGKIRDIARSTRMRHRG